MQKAMGEQQWTLQFIETKIEELYLEAKLQRLLTKFTLLVLAAVNVIVLAFLAIQLSCLAPHDAQFTKNLVALILLAVCIILEIGLMTIPALRWLRGIIYINGLSYILISLAEFTTYCNP